jgi:phenylacetate-CoA ligase
MQCEQGNYHVQDHYGVIEILDPHGSPAKPGEMGEIICTGLNNMAMPFIRYRTDDTAIPKPGHCPCGRGGALVERITGRIEDIIVTPDGRYLSRLDFVFKEMPNVKEAQLIQETPQSIRLRLVAGPAFSQSDKDRIAANLMERAGSGIRLQFELVDSIPRLPNGKFRYVISKVGLNFGGLRQTGEVVGVAAEEEKTL